MNDDRRTEPPQLERETDPTPGGEPASPPRVWGGAERLGYRRRATRLGARRFRGGARAARAGRTRLAAPEADTLLSELGPRVWEAVLLGLVASGLGQIYNGRWLRGLVAVLLPAALLVAAVWTGSPVVYLMAFWAGACTAPTVPLLFALLVGWVPAGHPAVWMGLPMKAAVVLDAGYTAFRLRRAGEVPRRPRAARALYLAGLGVLLLVWIFSLGLVSVREPDMTPVVEPGDHLVVDRLAFGVQIPLLGVRLGGRGLRRGDRVAVLDPGGSGRMLVRRVLALAGDRVAFGPPQDGVLGVAARDAGVLQPHLGRSGAAPKPVQWQRWPGPCVVPLSPRHRRPGRNYVRCWSVVEILGKRRYRVSFARAAGDAAARRARAPWAGRVPAGKVYLLADYRAARDSRAWGPVSERRVRGMPLAVLWSWDRLEGVRWHRMGARLEDWP